jgi:hypothetical protein
MRGEARPPAWPVNNACGAVETHKIQYFISTKTYDVALNS